jgi:transposase
MSPYHTEARFSVRRNIKWEGYRLHVTETCDADRPLLITNGETTTSVSLELECTDTIHQRLQEKDLLPKEHLVDAGHGCSCSG